MSNNCKGCLGKVEKCRSNGSKECSQCQLKGIDCIKLTEEEKLESMKQRCQMCSKEGRVCRPSADGIRYPCGNCIERRKNAGCVPPQMQTNLKRKVDSDTSKICVLKVRSIDTSTSKKRCPTPKSLGNYDKKWSNQESELFPDNGRFLMTGSDGTRSSSDLTRRASTSEFNNGSSYCQQYASALENPSTTRFDPRLEDNNTTNYQRPSNIRFSGCEEDRVQRLFVSLHDSLFEFETVVREDINKAQQKGNDHPSPDNVKEQQSELVAAIQRIMLQDELPTSSALEDLLKVTWTDSQSVENQLQGISLSLLHASLVSSYVFHFVQNRDVFNKQPCVAAMKVGFEVCRRLADDRYYGHGYEALREFQLELLHNKVWKEELFEASREKFSRDLLKFIEPLTKIFRVTECPLAELRGTIVDSALELWSYLQCLRGNLELIIPSRGDIFNPKEHDVVDAYSSRMEPWKATNKKVFLVRSPGLRWWPEISGCGKPVVALVLKARVIFDL